MMQPQPTQLGDYRILEPIGAGGMGQVYLAEHVHLRKKYALKLLPWELARDEQFIARFHDEARVMAELSHPHIVPVHFMGEHEGLYYLVMDYVQGPTESGQALNLHDCLAQRSSGRLEQEEAHRWSMQIAEALAYAHARGVVHRDLKPANILLDADGHVKLTDFGLVKAVGSEFLLSQIHQSIQQGVPGRQVERTLSDQQTLRPGSAAAGQAGSSGESLLGTYDYMAPEQREGGAITPATDVYAFGMLVYRMLTGRRLAGMARPASEAADVARSWDPLIRRCLEQEPSSRFKDGASLVQAMRKVRPARRLAVRRLLVAGTVAGLLLALGWGGWRAGEAMDWRLPGFAERPVTLQDVVAARATAEERWDQVQHIEPDRGFEPLLAEAARTHRQARAFHDRQDWPQALEAYEQLQDKSQALAERQADVERVMQTRREAEAARQAFDATESVALGVEALDSAQQHEARAQRLLDQGELDAAESAWRDAREAWRKLTLEARETLEARQAARQAREAAHAAVPRVELLLDTLAAAGAEELVKHYDDAEFYYESEMFQEALRSYESMLEAWASYTTWGEAGRPHWQALAQAYESAEQLDRLTGELSSEPRAVLEGALELDQVENQTQEAEAALQRGEVEAAAEAMTQALSQVLDAMVQLGRAYEDGDVLDQDYEQAVRWYRKAAEAGNVRAMNKLGFLYEGWGVDQDYEQAAYWHRQAAEAGDSSAMNNLGYLHQHGRGVVQDHEQAARWYRKAAEAGNAPGMYNLGLLYQHGRGVDQDYEQAARWYRQAAEAGTEYAMNNLGFLYRHGRGVVQDYEQAARWYRQAAEAGNATAMNNLGLLYQHGRGVPVDHEQAARWFRQAAEAGNTSGMYNLGYLHRHGRGVPQDHEQAARWYRQAAEAGHASAMNNLGFLYRHGRGVDQDYEQAARWYRQAAEAGDSSAMNNLGYLYQHGLGVEGDHEQAERWYRRAIDAGSEVAKDNLESLLQHNP